MTGIALAPGFSNPPMQAQATFRAVLEAMSRPGRIVCLDPLGGSAPAPLEPASMALALTLMDFETPVWLDRALRCPTVIESLRFHCGCPIVDSPDKASFALIAEPAMAPPLAAFDHGTDVYPDRSCTLILQVAAMDPTGAGRLRGPGIADVNDLGVEGLPVDFDRQWAANHQRFPQGVDVILVVGCRLAALPRTAVWER